MDLVNDVYSHLSRPGSGIKFIPFIQLVCVGIIGLCGMGIYNELAVPHMIMLIFLSSGLFVSLAVFDREIKGRGGWEDEAAKWRRDVGPGLRRVIREGTWGGRS